MKIRITVATGLALLALGMWAAGGGLAFVSAPAFLAVGFASACIIILTGAALLVSPRRSRFQRRTPLAIGIGIVALTLAGFAGSRLGIVLFEMPMAEVFVFAPMGSMLIAFHMRRVPADAVRLAGFSIIAAGLFGLASHFLDLGGWYSGYPDFQIAPLSLFALMACAGGIWTQCQQDVWRVRFDMSRDDKKISIDRWADFCSRSRSAPDSPVSRSWRI